MEENWWLFHELTLKTEDVLFSSLLALGKKEPVAQVSTKANGCKIVFQD